MDVRWRGFIWDSEKEKRVISERGITFKEAARATKDPHAVRGPDEFHSRRDEQRQWTVGLSPRKRLLLVITTEQEGHLIRIVTAWKAEGEDQELYEKTIR